MPGVKVLAYAMAALVGVYTAVALSVQPLQRRLIYFPNPERVLPVDAGFAGAVEETLETPDGARLVVWYRKAEAGSPTIFYLHGNGRNLASRAWRFADFASRGFGVYALAYRGYSGSTGVPSERANVADAEQAFEALLSKGVSPNDVVIYGESLGTSIAAQVASRRNVAGVVLDSPFTSMVALAGRYYPWLPAKTFMTDRYETLQVAPRITSPLLILHGGGDRLVPVAMAEEILRAATVSAKRIEVFPDVDHLDHVRVGSDAVLFGWISSLGLKFRAAG